MQSLSLDHYLSFSKGLVRVYSDFLLTLKNIVTLLAPNSVIDSSMSYYFERCSSLVNDNSVLSDEVPFGMSCFSYGCLFLVMSCRL